MNFDWTTFLLEILNFFVLLWILRRFLYRPVVQVIEARRQKIEEQLHQAEQTRRKALAEKAECEENLAAWEREKQGARAELEREIAAERERLLAALAGELDAARDKRRAQEARERRECAHAAERRALDLGGRFVGRLLERLASPALEDRLIAVVLADFPDLPEVERDKLRAALAEDTLEVASAYPLTEMRRNDLAEALARLAGRPVQPVFREDPALLAGLRMHAGPWMFCANLSDELKYFSDAEFQGRP